MRRKNNFSVLGLLPVFFCLALSFGGCKDDDYNKNEFRCCVNGECHSTPSKTIGKNLNYLSADSTLRIHGNTGPKGHDYKYTFDIAIPKFSGTGYYKINNIRTFQCNITVNQSTAPQDNYNIFPVYDGTVNITRSAGRKVAGYFHFVVRNPYGDKLFISNGRFAIDIPF